MARVLTVSRVRVPAANEADYVATLRALGQLAETRGERLWLFRSATDPRLFIEFAESATETGRPQAPLPEELALKAHLRGTVTYAPDAYDPWNEVPLDASPEAKEG
jgi:hypothetical protein